MRRLLPLALVLTACTATPQSRFFLLQPLAEGALAAPESAAATTGAPSADTPVADAPVSSAPAIDLQAVNVPALVNRPQMIERISEHECVYHEFWRWAEPLEDNIRDVLAGNLAALLAPAGVLPDAVRLGFDATLQITVDVLRFDWQPDGEAVLEARWIVVDRRGPADAPPLLWTQTLRSAASAGDPATLADAMSRNLLGLARAMATSLRQQIGEARPPG